MGIYYFNNRLIMNLLAVYGGYKKVTHNKIISFKVY